MKRTLLITLVCCSISLYADENSFFNANLQGYLDTHGNNVSVVDNSVAVNEEQQIAKEQPIAPLTIPALPTIINRTTIIENTPNNNGEDYFGGYYGYNSGGYSGYNSRLLREDEMHGRAVLNYAHIDALHY